MGCRFLLQCMKVKSESEVVSRVGLFMTPWTVAHQAPQSMGFPRQEYCSGVPSPSPAANANSVLVCCTCHFQSSSLFFVPFGLLSLQVSKCLTSALTQGAKVVVYLGSLVQLCCGEGGTLQTNITGVCGECLQCLGHTGFAPGHGVCFPGLHCSGSRLLCRGTTQSGPCISCTSQV